MSGTELTTVRASALPLAFLCAASLRPEGTVINSVNDAATNGTAAHACLQRLAETGEIDWSEVPQVALEHGADENEVRILCALGAKLWPSVANSFAGALSEVDLEAEILPGVTLTGHVDLLSISGTVARAADWKTGRKDSDYSQQMRAYGALVLLENKQLTEVTVTVLWVRDKEIENYTMSRFDAEEWLRGLVDRVFRWDGVYRPGNHCGHCNRFHECSAAQARVRSDLAVVADPELVDRVEGSIALMSPEEIVSIFRKADLVVKFAERVRSAIRRHVEANGDVVADGVRLTIDSEERREVDVEKAWPVLEAAGFKDADFAEVMTLSASKIEKNAASKAPRGKGAAAARAIKAQLEAANAIEFRQIKKLQARRA